MNARSCLRQLFAATFCATLLLVQSIVGQESIRTTAPESLQLYYGGDQKLVDSLIESIESNQIVVIDVRSLTAFQFGKLLRATSENDALLIAYISIGELHSNELKLLESFALKQRPSVDLAEMKSKTLIGENTDFESLHVDVVEDVWRDFVFDKAKSILATGVDGLFLDTVDTVDIYCEKRDWSLERRSKSVTAMISLIRELKSLDRSKHIMQNRGLNLIGTTVFIGNESGVAIPGMAITQQNKDNPDSILFENAFHGSDDWSQTKLQQLDAIQQSGQATVVALGYSDVIGDKATFLEKCTRYAFIPAWSANSFDLHKQITRMEPASK